ncbi:MAG: DinB family protein [Chitinophagaceae bacterium]|nr:DinB family protein [Chitinophagaceae bacterium]
MNKILDAYLRQLEDITFNEIWLDETFAKKFNQLSEENAFKNPLPGVHTVAEITSHLIEWRVSVLSILMGGNRTISIESPNNWKTSAQLQPAGWKALEQQFYASQQQLIDFLKTKDDQYLAQESSDGENNNAYYVEGQIHHDLYHLGQIGLVIKMLQQ